MLKQRNFRLSYVAFYIHFIQYMEEKGPCFV